jgi:hypothetical protein
MKKAKKKVSPRAATPVDAYIGAQMRDRRNALGLTQEALGRASRFSRYRTKKG